VRGGHNSQILDDLLGVLRLPGTRLPTKEERVRKIKRFTEREGERTGI